MSVLPLSRKELGIFLAAVLVCEATGILGSFFTAPQIDTWYATLVRPSIAPPDWVFGPVWTTLFFLMGVSLFLIWRSRAAVAAKRLAYGLFAIQLILNFFWSVLFFGLQNPGASFVEILVLWMAIASTLLAAARVSQAAAWLLVPYLLWVTFATYLNYAFWMLN